MDLGKTKNQVLKNISINLFFFNSDYNFYTALIARKDKGPLPGSPEVICGGTLVSTRYLLMYHWQGVSTL